MRARFRDTARGDDLTRIIVSDLGVEREGATPAQVDLRLSRSADSPPAITIEAGAIFSGDGQRFRTELPVFWALGDATDKVVPATALELGRSGNIEADADWSAETTLDDNTITITNTERAAGGNEEEDDDDYNARARDVVARFIKATLRAIELGALEVPQVRTATAYESLDSSGYPSGGVILTVADENGNSNSAMEEAVDLELYEWRAAAVKVVTSGAVVVQQECSMSAEWAPGFATGQNRQAVARAVVARVNKLKARSAPSGATVPIDCKLRPEALFNEAARTVRGCLGVTPIVPSGTVVPDPGQVLRTSIELVTVT